MSTGLIALLDDVVAIAKVAAASLDDAAMQAAKAGSKAAGIVIDDAAVTPRYVVGFASERELPIIWQIALGSLKNKLLILLPGALLLAWIAPWLITPLLMLGGAYLCLEGFHKVLDLVKPHGAKHDAPHLPQAGEAQPQAPAAEPTAGDLAAIEQAVVAVSDSELESEGAKVQSAIRTDFILSAEIMAISLASVAASPIWTQALVLAVVGVGMTVLVYGAVAIIVRADDWGAALARSPRQIWQVLGRGIVLGMPWFLAGLSHLGMLAMLWVGGGILVHGAHALGWKWPEETIHHLAHEWAAPLGVFGDAAEWLITATIAAAIGLIVGLICVGLEKLVAPLLARLQKKPAHNAG